MTSAARAATSIHWPRACRRRAYSINANAALAKAAWSAKLRDDGRPSRTSVLASTSVEASSALPTLSGNARWGSVPRIASRAAMSSSKMTCWVSPAAERTTEATSGSAPSRITIAVDPPWSSVCTPRIHRRTMAATR
jgi:hypothetical protein